MNQLSLSNFIKSFLLKITYFKISPKAATEDARPWLKMYDKGVTKTVHIPDETLVDFLEKAVHESGDENFINYFNRKINYSDFHNCVRRCAAGLQTQGIRQGDRVALVLPNIPQFLIAYWAVLSIGAIVVLVNPVLSAREIKEQIKIVDAKMIFILDRLLDSFLKESYEVSENILVTASVESFLPPVKRLAFHLQNPHPGQQLEKVPQRSACHFRSS